MTIFIIGLLVGFTIGYALKSYEIRRTKANYFDATSTKT